MSKPNKHPMRPLCITPNCHRQMKAGNRNGLCQSCHTEWLRGHSDWRSPEVRFDSKCEEGLEEAYPELGPCLLWTAGTNSFGYGQFSIGRQNHYAHRWAYEQATGEQLAKQEFICHRCDNPRCVRAEHLFKGLHLDNMQDKTLKQRQARGERCNKKLTLDLVLAIRHSLATSGLSQRKIASMYGISQSTTWAILHRRIWKHI